MMRFAKLVRYLIRREYRQALRPPQTEDELWLWSIK